MNSRGAREIYPSLDQINKVRSKTSKGFSGRNWKFKRFFRPKSGDLHKEKKRSSLKLQGVFLPKSEFQAVFLAKTTCSPKKKKKRSSSQKRHKIWCQSTKNTNLDLDLRSRSHEPVNFFEAQSSLGGAQFLFGGHKQSVGGARPRFAPRGAGSGSQEFAMRGAVWRVWR